MGDTLQAGDGATYLDAFRPPKRRKLYKKPKHEAGLEDDLASSSPSLSAVAAPSEQQVRAESPVAAILRQRKTFQRRRGGIGFSASAVRSEATHDMPDAASVANLSANVADVASRFAPQTGQAVSVDKHMMAYIDAKIAKRNTASQPEYPKFTSLNDDRADGKVKADHSVYRQPAALGALDEIDLGPSARAAAMAATDVARRRLRGEAVEEEQETRKPQSKPRLGPDGKPWRSRRRRNSVDMARDALVEAVMAENRIDMYDERGLKRPDAPADTEEGDPDERIAEQFRREFLDAAHARRGRSAKSRNANSRAANSGKGEKREERKKGPKLGGSRSARAKIREMEIAAAKAKKSTKARGSA